MWAVKSYASEGLSVSASDIETIPAMSQKLQLQDNFSARILELEREIKKLKSRKKYGLVWEDKPEQVVELCKDKLPVLTEDQSKEIKTDSTKPVNIIIEGDNFHSLSALNYTHSKNIDIIYIDPPYNTGNKDFIYNDSFVDKEDTYRHSKWIAFIERRLKLAKNLLKNTGVIFISIDDNEMAQLKLLCDDIFNENNFESFIWKKKGGAGNTEKIVGTLTEYILCYFHKKKAGIFNYRNLDRIYKYNDSVGPYSLEGIEKTNLGGYERKTMLFPIIDPETNKKFYPKENMRWTAGKDTVERLIEEKRIFFDYKKNKVFIIKRPENHQESENVYYNLLTDLGSLSTAKDELYRLFGNREIFDTPKPSSLIKHLLEIASKKDSIILDFFAGSGTTGQAVLALNDADEGNRRFVLCTDNGNNICTEICYPRIEKIINGYVSFDKKEKIKGLGGNLKYFKTDFVEAKQTDKNKKKLVDKSTEMLCLKEDCFDVVKSGKNFKIFTNNQGKNLGIIYDDAGIDAFKKEVQKLNQKVSTYVFSLDDSAREEEFEDIEKLVDLKPIPAVILNVYKRIFK